MHHSPVSISFYQAGTTSEISSAHEGALKSMLDRIEQLEPTIQAMLPEPGRRNRVLEELRALLHQYQEIGRRPKLFGVPFGIKDIFHADGFETYGGSTLPPELLRGPESQAVSRLKRAGAVAAGKTVTTEFAYMHPGPTRNPWNIECTPGGSSSGSAAGVSAGYFPFALGTQTVGSVIRPAAFCGIVGFKPSFGRIPEDGMIQFSISADHVGILAADTRTAAAVSEVLLDHWNALQFEVSQEVRTPKIIILKDSYTSQASAEAREAVEITADLLAREGFAVEEAGLFDDIETLNELHQRMIAREFRDVHAPWFQHYSSRYSEPSRKLIELGDQVGERELMDARNGRMKTRNAVNQLLSARGADALLAPSSGSSAPEGISYTGSSLLNLPWTYAGVPAVTVPASISPRNLPLGVQCIGGFDQDEQLLSLTSRIEHILRIR